MLFIGVLHPSFDDEPKWERELYIDIKQYYKDFIDAPIRLNYYRVPIGSIQDAWISDRGQLCIIGKIDCIPPYMDLAISYEYDMLDTIVTRIRVRGCDIVPEARYKTTKITCILPISSFGDCGCGSRSHNSRRFRKLIH